MDLGTDIIRGKWKTVILCHLYTGPKRFLQLQRITQGVSHKVLNQKLSELENDGLILKKVFNELPPKVEYHLTKKGIDLYPALEIIEQWSKKYYSDNK